MTRGDILAKDMTLRDHIITERYLMDPNAPVETVIKDVDALLAAMDSKPAESQCRDALEALRYAYPGWHDLSHEPCHSQEMWTIWAAWVLAAKALGKDT